MTGLTTCVRGIEEAKVMRGGCDSTGREGGAVERGASGCGYSTGCKPANGRDDCICMRMGGLGVCERRSSSV